MVRLRLVLMLLFLQAAAMLTALPPPAPGAGVIERELEKEYESKPLEIDKNTPSIRIDIPEEQLEMPDGQKVFIRQIEVHGNTVIKASQMVSWVERYQDRVLSLRDVYELCQRIELGYAAEGYFLARAYPPPQTIENGILIIEVLEGKLGNVTVVGNKHYKTSFIESYFASLQDKPLRYNDFLRALLLLNDNTDLIAGAVFEKGKELGYADVIIRVEDKRPIHLYLNGNNYGRNLTTNVRVGARLDRGNLLVNGDTFSIAEVVGFPLSALYFTDVRYIAPLNHKGTSLEIAYLYSRFEVEELINLHLKGSSQIATLKANHALMRRRLLNLDLFSYFDYKQFQNFVLGQRTSYDRLRVLTVGALIDHFSPKQGRDYLTLRFAAGIPDFLGGLKAIDNGSSRPGAGGRFFKFNADYDRIQHMPKDWYLYLHGSGQYSFNKLTLPEQIYIGGNDTVRGFPLAVALGDSGYYFNIEFRFPPLFLANKRFFGSSKKWKEIIQFDAFLDHGGVFLQSEQNTFLWGTGVGLRINGPWNFNFSLDVGFPLNHEGLTRDVFTYIKLTCQAF